MHKVDHWSLVRLAHNDAQDLVELVLVTVGARPIGSRAGAGRAAGPGGDRAAAQDRTQAVPENDLAWDFGVSPLIDQDSRETLEQGLGLCITICAHTHPASP